MSNNNEARVAKVKRSTPRHAPPPQLTQPLRRNMRHLAKWMLIVLAVLTVTPLLVSLAMARAVEPPSTDCRALIAGWHPDVPAHIRIKCGWRA